MRRTPIKRVNAKRKQKRAEADAVYGSFFRWVASLPCAVQGEGRCIGAVVGHHIKSVGSGGVDAGNLAPLCEWHHAEIHFTGPVAFDQKYFNDLKLYANRIWQDYQGGLHA